MKQIYFVVFSRVWAAYRADKQRLLMHLLLQFLVVATLSVAMPTSIYAQSNFEQIDDCPDGLPFLGIGLGYNQYTLEQVNNISQGNRCQQPLLYNWSLGDSPQTPENFPYKDFPATYIPMLWGCAADGPMRVQQFVETHDYAGPMLIFNEPDRADQANCAPERAAPLLNELHHTRVAYELATGNRLRFYVGGLARSDSGIGWIDKFRASYIEMYGADPFGQDGTPDSAAYGIHFHLYPRFAYPDGAGSFADVNTQLTEWDGWLTENELHAWVTEVGVLHAPYQPLPKDEYVSYLEQVLPLLFWNERIDHAFIFTLNAIGGTDSAEFAKSALIEDEVETAAYRFVQDICGLAGSGYCTPGAKGLIRAAAGVKVKDKAEANAKVEVEKEMDFQLNGLSTFTRPNAESYRIGYMRN